MQLRAFNSAFHICYSPKAIAWHLQGHWFGYMHFEWLIRLGRCGSGLGHEITSDRASDRKFGQCSKYFGSYYIAFHVSFRFVFFLVLPQPLPTISCTSTKRVNVKVLNFYFSAKGWSPKGWRGKENTLPARQQLGFKPGTFWSLVECFNHLVTVSLQGWRFRVAVLGSHSSAAGTVVCF